MDDLLPGLKQVRFSALGYATRSELVEVLPDRVTNLRVSLSADPVELTPIEVTVERRDFTLQDAGYYNREAEGFGEFIDREVIEARRPAEMSDLFSRLPGVEIFAAPDDPLEKYIVLRGGRQSSFSSGPYQRCFPKVVMDGLVMNQGGRRPRAAGPADRSRSRGGRRGLFRPLREFRRSTGAWGRPAGSF